MTIEEIIHAVNQELTVSGKVQKDIPDVEIRRIINEALDWFYWNYPYALYKTYYFVPNEKILKQPHISNTGYVELPDCINNVIYVYAPNRNDLFQLGVYAPDLRIGLGVTSQPYLTSYITSIGELTVTRTAIQSFGEVLRRLTRTTIKWDYDNAGKTLHLLSNLPPQSHDIVLECYKKSEPEHLFEDNYFRRYVFAYGKKQLGMILARYDFQLPGNFKVNYDTILRYADEELREVKDEIKAMSKSTFLRIKN